jgi:HK97 family phage portal protein
MKLLSLNLEQPTMRADYESGATTGASLKDIASMEQFLLGVRTHSGQTVTPEKARRCSAVLACMRGISEDVSALPLKLYKRGPNGDAEAFDHNLYNILNMAPNDLMTSIELREHMIFDMMLYGNFYNLVNEDPDSPGDIGSVWPLQAGYVVRRWQEAIWTYTDPLTGVSGSFTPDTVWRGTVMSANGLDGTALTLLAREAIGLLIAAEEQGARLFSQGVQTDLTLSSDETVDEDQKTQLRQAFMARHAGSSNAWMPMLLEGGLKAARLGLTAQESQYIEARAFQIGDVARVFRYPDVLLGSLGKGSKASTYASAEQFFQSYTKHTLAPWTVRIEQTCHRDLLNAKEKSKYFIKHDFESLLRGDTAARYASYTTGIASGFMSPADARRKENMPYVEGLDYYTRPLNTAATAGGDAAAVKPTDVSGEDELPRRVANLIFKKERKALVLGKGDAEYFYGHFSGFLEDTTGADATSVHDYLEMRRTNPDRFSTEAQDAAIAALISLCKKDN